MTLNSAHITEAEKNVFKYWIEKTYVESGKFSTDSNSAKLKHLFERVFGHYAYEDDVIKLMEQWGYASKDLGGGHVYFKLRFRDKSMEPGEEYSDAGRLGVLLDKYKNELSDSVE